VDKNWKVKERVTIQFRFDFFNLFNHPNFNGGTITGIAGSAFAATVNCGPANSAGLYSPCSPANNVISAQTLTTGVGQATQARQSREMQYGLKIMF